MKQWHSKYTSCVQCGTTGTPHKAHGKCVKCYSTHRWHNYYKDMGKKYNLQAPKPVKRTQLVYHGPIHAGDGFASSQTEGKGLFIWGRLPNGKIELRSYGRVSENDKPVKKLVFEYQLRTEWNRIKPNPVGTLICPALKELKC